MLKRRVLGLLILLGIVAACQGPPLIIENSGRDSPGERTICLVATPFTNASLVQGAVFREQGSVIVTTLAGRGKTGPLGGGYRDGAVDAAMFHEPAGIAVWPGGTVVVSDWVNHRIRLISPDAGVTTLAGGGDPGPWGNYRDGAGIEARFNGPEGLAVDDAGNIYVADSRNHRIRKVTPAGQVTTVAGNGDPGFLGGYADGKVETAFFRWPMDVILDGEGNLLVADFNNHAIRVVAPTGGVLTRAGSGQPGDSDGQGAGAGFSTPNRLDLAPDGRIIVSEGAGFYGGGGHRIRQISMDGTVSTLAGTGERGYRDGPAHRALFNIPNGVAVTADGVIYVADSGNHVIRRIGTGGMVTTLAGSGESGFNDGPGHQASFWYPSDLEFLPDGRLLVADRLNHRVRVVTME
ncbi:MAG: NHL repeat-containing protein [Chloroflexota bacterium]|nr:NHL repeat-containing protein [Chloroflexota bacterium]